MHMLETIDLARDELEAIRLTDLEGLYHEPAAKQMGVSRQTLGNILKRAHKKIAEALIQGKAIQLETAHPPQMDAMPQPDANPPQNAMMPPRGGRGRGGHGRGGRGRM